MCFRLDYGRLTKISLLLPMFACYDQRTLYAINLYRLPPPLQHSRKCSYRRPTQRLPYQSCHPLVCKRVFCSIVGLEWCTALQPCSCSLTVEQCATWQIKRLGRWMQSDQTLQRLPRHQWELRFVCFAYRHYGVCCTESAYWWDASLTPHLWV